MCRCCCGGLAHGLTGTRPPSVASETTPPIPGGYSRSISAPLLLALLSLPAPPCPPLSDHCLPLMTLKITFSKSRRLGQQFYYAFCFLPPQRRAAITTFYAFCREVDDVVDEVHDPPWPRKTGVVARRSVPMPTRAPPTSHAGTDAARTAVQHPGQTVANRHSRAARWIWNKPATSTTPDCNATATCGRRGGRSVGQHLRPDRPGHHRLCTHIGPKPSNSPTSSATWAKTLRGRIYLPVNELQQFDVKAQEILKRTHSDRFVALMRFQAARAHALYDQALALLPPPTAAPKTRSDDGQHLPHPAARNRDRPVPGAGSPRLLTRCANSGLPGKCRHWAGCECPPPLNHPFRSERPAQATALRPGVVGGGWAGLAAAVRAAHDGHHVTVFEASRTWEAVPAPSRCHPHRTDT